MQAVSERAQGTWDKFQKERDFHRMHHKRVVQAWPIRRDEELHQPDWLTSSRCHRQASDARRLYPFTHPLGLL